MTTLWTRFEVLPSSVLDHDGVRREVLSAAATVCVA
jgi:hypothetical protein